MPRDCLRICLPGFLAACPWTEETSRREGSGPHGLVGIFLTLLVTFFFFSPSGIVKYHC